MTDSRLASAPREKAFRGSAALSRARIGTSKEESALAAEGPEARPPSCQDVEVRGSHLSKTAKGGPASSITR